MAETTAIVTELAGYAEEYRRHVFDEVVGEFGVTREELCEADPRTSLKVFFRLYGFNRAGGMQAGYHRKAVSALEQSDGGEREDSVEDEIDSAELWSNFVAECERTDTGVNEQINRGVVRDTARLVNREGNLFRWVGREVRNHGRLATLVGELTDVRGIGPSIARFFLRDAVWLCGVENRVRPPDRHHLQSMTRWVEDVTVALWPVLEDASSDVLANHLAGACAEHGVSGAAFNQGAWYFAREEVGDDADLEPAIQNLGTSPRQEEEVSGD